MNDIEYITKRLDENELLCQVAEEAGELAQAALKLRRALTGQNPTPVPVSKAVEKLLEEMADVNNAGNVWLYYVNISPDVIAKTEREKRKRWAERLRVKEFTSKLPEAAETIKKLYSEPLPEIHEAALEEISSPAFVDAFRGLAKAVSESTGRMYVEVIDSAKDMLAKGAEPLNVMGYFARLAFGGGSEK